jgi:hypothetical protein
MKNVLLPFRPVVGAGYDQHDDASPEDLDSSGSPGDLVDRLAGRDGADAVRMSFQNDGQ